MNTHFRLPDQRPPVHRLSHHSASLLGHQRNAAFTTWRPPSSLFHFPLAHPTTTPYRPLRPTITSFTFSSRWQAHRRRHVNSAPLLPCLETTPSHNSLARTTTPSLFLYLLRLRHDNYYAYPIAKSASSHHNVSNGIVHVSPMRASAFNHHLPTLMTT
ncbi:hypothetical protein BDQ17DRAFT_1364497 [Cyathus striatus]|nr:hypothetical protein BDQ17DRAFT_1364497 [Cyathus striatus]